MDYEPDENEQAVLDVLREERRANPYLIREKIDLRKEYVSKALTGLVKAGVVEKVTRGLYEHVPENDDEYTDDDEELQRAVRDARDAYQNLIDAREHLDQEAIDEALAGLGQALEVNDG